MRSMETIEISEEIDIEMYDEPVEIIGEKEKHFSVVFVGVVIALVALIFVAIGSVSPSFDDTVLEYSDNAPRVGNNIYGYINVPEGFTMTGSFCPDDENYVGGADGIPEGVQLKNETGSMYIVLSLVTPDKQREDYIGFGDGMYQLYDKKKRASHVEDVFDGVAEDLREAGMLSLEPDGMMTEGTFVHVNGLKGMGTKWKGDRDGKTYQYQTYILENPERKGVFHCITAAFLSGNEECVDSIQTFSLSKNQPQSKMLAGVGARVGTKETGYMNIPSGFKEYHGTWFYQMMDDIEKDVDMIYCASEALGEEGIAFDEAVLVCGFQKSKDFEESPESYIDLNFPEVYGYLNALDCYDVSQLSLQGEQREFGVELFLAVMEQTLGAKGKLTSQPATLDGQQGYRVTWEGRHSVEQSKLYLSFYILENAENPEVVYVIGATEQTEEGQFWKYMDSFTIHK